jgi:hypothetical protein
LSKNGWTLKCHQFECRLADRTNKPRSHGLGPVKLAFYYFFFQQNGLIEQSVIEQQRMQWGHQGIASNSGGTCPARGNTVG